MDRKTRSNLEVIKQKDTTKFINNLDSIIKAIFEKNKSDPDMIELMDKFSVVRKEDPILIISRTGPYLWKYKEEINKQNVDFFLRNSFEEDIIQSQQKSQVAEISELEDIPVLLNKAKITWQKFLEPEKQAIMKKIRGMLSNYSSYTSACKKLGES